MSLETRSNSALMKRAEQLKRWQESDTFKEPGQPRAKKSRRVGFSDGCVFLAACAAGEKAEVEALLKRGADIDTANVDGLTALHQACIDDNLEMVEFLIEHDADVNRGDNEGWTPLHATASCGFLSIARYLMDNNADVAAVNNDGELAIDISESDEMEELLQKQITNQRVDCEEARNKEEREMMKDARHWIQSGALSEEPHPKTGASALHVAAAKGYIKVMKLLLKAAAPVNAQDMDGWTPMHAAAHWAQREACELLVENGADMEVKNCVGQTAFDVTDPDILRLLEELKKKAASLQKDKPVDLSKLQQDNHSLAPKRSTMNHNRSEVLGSNDSISSSDRSSITRLSYDDKILRSKEATVKETIAEEKGSDKDEKSSDGGKHRVPDSPGLLVTDEAGKESAPGFAPPHPDTDGGKEEIAPWRRPGSLRSRPISGLNSGGGSTASAVSAKLSPSTEDGMVRRAHSFGSDDKFYAKLAELRQRIRANSLPVLHAAEPGAAGIAGSHVIGGSNSALNTCSSSATNQSKYCDIKQQSNTLPRPNKPRLPCLIESASEVSPPSLETVPPLANEVFTSKLPVTPQVSLDEAKPPIPPKPFSPSLSFMSARPFSRSADGTAQKLTELTLHDDNRKRLTDDYGKSSPEVLPRNRVDKSLSAQVRRSFVPPVRDEEHEIQRKAHAKRVRETRRSTQGVTLEDLKSAEQLVKKKQQQENAQRTTELQNLAHHSNSDQVPDPPGSTATTTVNTTATLVPTDSEKSAERRPSWRLRIDSGERSRFTLEDSRGRHGHSDTRQPSTEPSAVSTIESRREAANEILGRHHTTISTTAASDRISSDSHHPSSTESTGSIASSVGSGRITRPFSSTYSNTLHPTDIGSPSTPTQLAISRKKKPKRRSTGVIDMDDLDKSDDNADENIPTSSSQAAAKSKATNQNGEIDYKKLWEESETENTRLRKELMTIKQDLESSKHQLESAVQASTKNSISDTEKREKKVLEKKLAEMEEELKTLDQLKADNQRLRDENGALIRVISKLSK